MQEKTIIEYVAYEPVINVRPPLIILSLVNQKVVMMMMIVIVPFLLLLVYFNHYYYCFSWSNCLLPNEKQKIATKSQNCLV